MKSKIIIFTGLLFAVVLSIGIFVYLQDKKDELESAFYLENAEMMKQSSRLQMSYDLSSSQLLAISLSNNPLIKQTLQERSPGKTEESLNHLAAEINKNSNIGQVWIHVVSKDLYSIYRSWDKKRGDHLWFRKDLQFILKNVNNHQGISVGKYNISYKNTIPVYDDQQGFIGFVEAITFLPSTMESLLRDEKIRSTVIIDKQHMKQLTSNVNNRFLGEHVVAFNNDLELLKKLDEATVFKLINSPYQVMDGRLITARVLDNLAGLPMGYILLALPKSIFESKLKETLEEINLLIAISVLIFVLMLGYAIFYLRTISEEMKLVRLLNEELQQTIDMHTKKIKEQEFIIHEQSKNQAMTELLVNLAHHWRQPISTALLNLDRIEDIYEFENGDRKKIDDAIELASKELETLSDSITDLTRIFEGGADEYTTLKEAVFITRQFIEDTLNIHSIKIVTDIDEDILLQATKGDMLEILSALFLNVRDIVIARRKEGATIIVSQSVLARNVLIEVEDDVGGIVPELLPDKIFEPFSTTHFKTRNKGVGLYRIRQLIVEHIKGEIYVQNSEKGAKFMIRLPYE